MELKKAPSLGKGQLYNVQHIGVKNQVVMDPGTA